MCAVGVFVYHLFIARDSRRPACTKIKQGFRGVCFALRVIAGYHVDALNEIEGLPNVIAVVCKIERSYIHGLKIK